MEPVAKKFKPDPKHALHDTLLWPPIFLFGLFVNWLRPEAKTPWWVNLIPLLAYAVFLLQHTIPRIFLSEKGIGSGLGQKRWLDWEQIERAKFSSFGVAGRIWTKDAGVELYGHVNGKKVYIEVPYQLFKPNDRSEIKRFVDSNLPKTARRE